MWLKSHHWVNNPTSTTERRLSLNTVRARTETVRLFDVKYRDIDTGKLNFDYLPTLNSTSYQDVVWECDDRPSHRYRNLHDGNYNVEKWFTPKDDDFDDECSREDQLRKEREQREQKERERIKAEQAEAVEIEKARLKSILNEHVYAQLLEDAEHRQRMRGIILAASPQPGRTICNVRPNNWRPK